MAKKFEEIRKSALDILANHDLSLMEPEVRNLLQSICISKNDSPFPQGDSSYGTTLENAPVSHLVITESKLIVQANEAFCRLFHYSREVVIGQPITNFMAPIFRDTFDHFLLPLKNADDNVLQTELKMISKYRREIYVKVDANRHRNGEHYNLILTDITLQKNLSVKLAREREISEIEASKHRQVLENLQSAAKMSDMTCFECRQDGTSDMVYNDSKNIPNVNNHYLPDEKWVHPEDYVELMSQWNKLFAGEITELRCIYRSNYYGAVRYYRMVAVLRYPASAPRAFGLIQDITEAIETQQKLEEADKLWNSVISFMPVYLFGKDVENDFRYVLINQPFLNYMGLSREALIGKNDFEIRSQEDAQRVRQADLLCLESKDGVEQIETITGANGEVRSFRSTKKLFITREGTRVLLGVYSDVTELINTNRELEKAIAAAQAAEKIKQAFLATMSHEFRTPLNTVIGFSELLANVNVSNEELSEYIANINMAGKTLLGLITDVLDLSRIEAGQVQITLKSTLIEELLREQDSIFHQAAVARGIHLRFECPQTMPRLLLDELRVRQILLNLVGNAVKFTFKGGVVVSASYEDGKLDISVKDTGVGIQPENLKNIFEPFVKQGTGKESLVHKGTGLGLAISRKLAERMGGTIRLESTFGEGSNFTLHLDNVAIVEEVPPKEVGSQPEAQVLKDPPPITALVVDDLPDNALLLMGMLKKLKIKSTFTCSAKEALELVRKEKPDVVLADIWMPEINGQEMARIIRATPELAGVKLYAISADEEIISKEDMSDFDGALLKPISIKALQNLLLK